MIRFDHPELLLLALPVIAAQIRLRPRAPAALVLRLLASVLLAATIAGPRLDSRGNGNDVIVVVDRSRSMPAGAEGVARETIGLLEKAMGRGDRLGVVAFGRDVAVEQAPRDAAGFAAFSAKVDPDGSDLGAAIDAALGLVPEGRSATILVVSDGESRGRDPIGAARRSAARGVPVFVRPTDRATDLDVAVERVEVPPEVHEGEPFQFSAWVHADSKCDVRYALKRDGDVIAEGTYGLEPGTNRLMFRDKVGDERVAQYRLEIFANADHDRVPENSSALAVVHVSGRQKLLVLNDDGSRDAVVSAFDGGGIAVDVNRPEDVMFDAVALSRYRAVVVENISAQRIGKGMKELASFVGDRGGGLMMTGGKASFGVGGYYKSEIDKVLPVTMELRKETRKLAIAVAFALDRSGSMAMAAGGGKTKMDLADQGTAAAIQLMSPIDSVAVVAIDSSPHVVVSMRSADDYDAIVEPVLRIESSGGGIFTHVAMVAATDQIKTAEQANRHIVLFADAADAEEHEGCVELARDLESTGVTTSVIALGTEHDSDAAFLKEVAAAGGGQAFFADAAEDLPRLFSHDLMLVARAGYVTGQIGTVVLPDLLGLGAATTSSFPSLGAYNLTYLREGSLAGVATTDNWKAPIVAFRYHGLGRSAAITTPIDHALLGWEGFPSFMVTLGRWLLGQEAPEAYFTTVRREGSTAVIGVELDPSHDKTAALPREAVVRAGSGGTTHVVLERVSENRAEARVPLSGTAVMLGAIDAGEHRVLTLPPVALPYSPEFERSPDPRRGSRLLQSVAAESGGAPLSTVDPLFEQEGSNVEARAIGRPLAMLALLVFLLELLERRFGFAGGLFAALRKNLPRRAATVTIEATVTATLEPQRSRAPETPVAPPQQPSPTAGTTDAAALARALKQKRKRGRL